MKLVFEKKTWLLLFLISFGLLLNKQSFAQDKYSDLLSRLDTFYLKTLKKWEVPGMAIAIVKNDSLIFAKGYGVQNVNFEEPVNEHTMFPVASLTKSFTATAIGILVDQGLISWEDKVRDYLPWFEIINPYVSANMTIRDLLSHRSGLKTFSGDLLWYGTNYDREEVIRKAKYLKPEYGFREHFGYSNIMYIAAGEIIDKVTCKSWDDFIREYFFLPLDMDRTATSITDMEKMENVTSPHTECEDKTIPIDYLNWDNIGGAGAIVSNAEDMSHWLLVNLNEGVYKDDTVFSGSILRELWKPHTIQEIGGLDRYFFPKRYFKAYGMGWGLFDYLGKKIVLHSGGYDGIISQMALVPEEELGVVILTNKNEWLILPVLYQTLNAFLSEDDKDWGDAFLEVKTFVDNASEERKKEFEEQRVNKTSPSLSLESYTGIYEDPMYGKAKIYFDGKDLKIHLMPTDDFIGDLSHYHYDVFRIEFKKFPSLPQGLVNFTLDNEGKVNKMVVDVPNPDFDFTEMEFVKLED